VGPLIRLAAAALALTLDVADGLARSASEAVRSAEPLAGTEKEV
jgi:hypothetical protein